MSKRAEIQKLLTDSIVFNNFTGIFVAAPRVGKSKALIDSLNTLGISDKVLITVPFDSIKESWEDELVKWSSKIKPDIINQRSLNKVVVGDYDYIICDEVHTLSEAQLEILKELKTYSKLMGVTGSLADETARLLKFHLGLIVNFNYGLELAINDKIISDYRINIITCNLDNTNKYIVGGTKKNSWLTTEAAQYDYLTRQFNRFKVMSFNDEKFNGVKMNYARLRSHLLYTCDTKVNIAKKLINNSSKALVFTTLIDTCNKLTNDSYHSKSNGDELELFKQGKINHLSVINMSSMGVTFPNLKYAICHQLQSSEELAVQKLLRTMNFDAGKDAVIDIIVANNTVDEDWCKKALQGFDSNKINYIDSRSIK